jgi:hypothetical protein
MAVTSRIRVDFQALLQSVFDLGQGDVPQKVIKDYTLPNGVGTAGVDGVFADERTLAASATENLDLSGVLTDAFGSVLSFARIKALIVQANDANVNDVHVGVGAANGLVTLFPTASSHVKVKPGGLFVWVAPGAGILVTAGTGDLLVVTNSAAGTSVTYKVIVVGASA